MKQRIPSTADAKSHSSPYIKLPIKFPPENTFFECVLWLSSFGNHWWSETAGAWDTAHTFHQGRTHTLSWTIGFLYCYISRGNDKILLFQDQSWIWLTLGLARPCLTGGDEMRKKLWVAGGCKLKAGSGSPLSVPMFTEAASAEWMLIRNCVQP